MAEDGMTEEAQKLVNIGVGLRVAKRVGEIFSSGALLPEELDDRALEALKEFNEEGALEVLNQFAGSDLSHVQNKSAFLCGIMKTYREKNRMKREGQDPMAGMKGPDETKIKTLLERTGYSLDITTGQRKYGGPPPGWEGSPPGTGSEKVCSQVFVGKIPRDCFEDELIPVLEDCGRIYDFRLMIDPISGLTKGFGFCTFTNKTEAQQAVKKLDNKEIRPGKKLGVCISVANNRLFVGSIPKTKSKQEIFDEFDKVISGLSDVIVYMSSDQKGKNRGFAFLEFESHQAAALARRKLSSGRIKVWGTVVVTVDWADPQDEPDEEAMSKVKVVYVRNLSPSITEEKLKEVFQSFGTVDRTKKIKDYAFVHFTEREHALKAIEEMHNKELDGINIEVSLAKPRDSSSQRDRRQGQSGYGSLNQFRGGGGGARGRGGRGRGGDRGRGRGGYDRGYDYGGGNDGYYDEGYGGGYGGGGDYSYGGGSGDFYDSYYGGSGGDSGYDGYYSGGGRGGRGGEGRGGYQRGGGRGGPRGGPRGGRGGGGRGGGGGGYGEGFNRGRGRGGRGGGGDYGERGRGAGGLPPSKRKYGADNPGGVVGYPEPKKRYNPDDQYWGTQPIAQAPQYSSGYGDSGQEWYQDSYSQQWN